MELEGELLRKYLTAKRISWADLKRGTTLDSKTVKTAITRHAPINDYILDKLQLYNKMHEFILKIRPDFEFTYEENNMVDEPASPYNDKIIQLTESLNQTNELLKQLLKELRNK